MIRRLALTALLLTGCASQISQAGPKDSPANANWQASITGADRQRLARLWDAWTNALAEAKAAGQQGAVAALGPLAEADAATMNRDASDPMVPSVAGPLPGPGRYRCRMVKLGRRVPPGATLPVDPRLPVVVAGNSVACMIEARGSDLWFEIAPSGEPQRLGGRLYRDGDRMVFLGTTALVGEMGVMPYGIDPERDAVGALRAVAPAQWRLELPWPNWQANLVLIEVLPE